MRIRGLWYDGLLDPMPENRPPNPVYAAAGPNFVNGGYVLVLGGQQLYSDTSAIEQWFFYTYKYDHVNTFKGAYHINPDYSHWFGWSEVNQDIGMIRGEEASLRRGEDPGFTASPTRARGRAADDVRRERPRRVGRRQREHLRVDVRRQDERGGRGRRRASRTPTPAPAATRCSSPAPTATSSTTCFSR